MRLFPDLQARLVRREVRVETRWFVRSSALAERPTGPFTDADMEERTGPIECIPEVDALGEAHGVWFLCPKCYAENGGPIGTHAVLCWFVGRVPDDADPKPGRWTPTGTGLSNLTFVPSPGRSQSVLLTGGCGWHGFVADGNAT
jgi:hypothetical protein